jgi:hypothetical protein
MRRNLETRCGNAVAAYLEALLLDEKPGLG